MRESKKKKAVGVIPDRSSYLRVTKILSVLRTGLDDFLDRCGETARATIFEKAEYGNQVHEMCDKFNKAMIGGKVLSVDDVSDENYFEEAIFSFSKYRTWVFDNVKEIVQSEMEVFHDDYKYCGHLDVKVQMKGDEFLSVVDIKTPATPSRTWFLQIEAYRRAVNFMKGKEIAKRGFALITTPDGCKVKESKDPQDILFANFLYAQSLKKYMNPKGEKK